MLELDDNAAWERLWNAARAMDADAKVARSLPARTALEAAARVLDLLAAGLLKATDRP